MFRAPKPGLARRIRLLAAVPLLLACLAGCVKIQTTVTPDGRIRREIRCEVTKDHRESARIELQRVFQRGSGWYLREIDKGQTVSFLATCRAVKPEKDPFNAGSAAFPTVTRTPQGMTTQYSYEEQLTDQLLFSDNDRIYAKDLPVTYTIAMPGRIDEGGATITLKNGEPVKVVSEDGKEVALETKYTGGVVSWTMTMGQLAQDGLKITVTSTRRNAKFAFAVGFGALLGLVVLYVLLVRLSVWRRVRAEQAIREPLPAAESAIDVLDADDDAPAPPRPPIGKDDSDS